MLRQFTLDQAIEVEQFNQLAIDLYQNENGHYASQANRINESLFVKGFLVTIESKAAARGILYNPGLLLEGNPILFFGNFEARDQEAGTSLLQAMEEYVLKEYPGVQLLGPVNGTTWNDYRMPLDEQHILFPNDVCAGSFYHTLFIEKGYEVLYQYNTNLQTDLTLRKLFHTEEFTTSFFTKEEFNKRLGEIYTLTIEAFNRAPLFSPISEDAFMHKQLQLLPCMDMNLVPFVLDQQQAIVGYAFCYQGFEEDSLVVKTVARKNGRQYAGLGRILSECIIQTAKDRGVAKVYHAFMHEQNTSNRLSANGFGKNVKQYAVYRLKKCS